MTEFLVCPQCTMACFILHSDPTANDGVFVNRLESLPAADRCRDKHTAPCGRALVRLHAVAQPLGDATKCDCIQRSA